ncbi:MULTISPECIES: cytochrome c [unclassified Yoonia]|uniref:c-type cytochrome n=1 Tax=unclassified Yoonia TaxID=2629118 RepID=UPI002AFED85D|nr:MULTISPECIES: cytochrome c [unclassified Yoonia]
MTLHARSTAALWGCLTFAALPALADPAEIFAGACGACHGAAGEGIPGFAPKLDRPAFWQAMGDDAPTYLGGVILSGLAGRIEADGQTFVGVSMPRQANLEDAEIIAIADHILASFGAEDQSLSPETLAALRSDPPSHADLLAMRKPEE